VTSPDQNKNGKLFLVPTPIAEETHFQVLTPQVKNELTNIRFFLVENIRTARRYLSSLKVYDSVETLDFKTLDKDTPYQMMKDLLEPITRGLNVGILSESGCPGIADPGALAVRAAHELGIEVVPLVGPSSILLALMASGLNGQRFAFQGYLPIESKEASRVIRDLEKESRNQKQTQIAIETPYRNKSLFQNLLKNLNETTLLCVASDITGKQEFIRTMTVKSWRKERAELDKLPALFLFLAGS
jgi:16S rRNA (cytidine1402-2'-O)-methyltransferase